MASGRKHASFRHRSQSDNGVIIELTPLTVGGGCISPRLLPGLGASQRLPSWLQPPAGPRGEVLSFAFGGVQAKGLGHSRAPDSLCRRLPCPWKVSSGTHRDIFCRRLSWPFLRPANGRDGGGSQLRGWSFWEPGVSDVPCDSSKRLLEESAFVFFVLLVDWESGFGKFIFSF